MERALELRSELEDAASDITNLFTKIGLHPYSDNDVISAG